MEPLSNVREGTEDELEAVPLGSTAEEEGGRQEALDEIAGLSHKVSRRHSRSPLLKVPLALIIIVLLAFIAYHMTALVLKDSRVIQRPGVGLAGLLSGGKGAVDATKGKQTGFPVPSDGTPVTDQPQEPEDRQQPGAPPPSAPAPDSASRVPTGSTHEEDLPAGKPEDTAEQGTAVGRGSLPSEGSAEGSSAAAVAREPLTSVTSVPSEEGSAKPEGIEEGEEAGAAVVRTPVTTSSDESGREFGEGDFSDAEEGKGDFPKRKKPPRGSKKESLKRVGRGSSLEGREAASDLEGDDNGYLASDEASVEDDDEENTFSSMNTDEMEEVSEAESEEDEEAKARREAVSLMFQRYDQVRDMLRAEADRLEGTMQWISSIPYGENDWTDDDVFTS